MDGENQNKIIKNSNSTIDNNSLIVLVSIVLVAVTVFVFRQHRNNFLLQLKNSQHLNNDKKKSEHSTIFIKYLEPLINIFTFVILLITIILALREIKKKVFDS